MRKSYADLLKDPRWQRKRLEIMQRDDFTCQGCFDKENTLNVYHKYYIHGRNPWDYPSSLLVTLCEECHKLEEELQPIQEFMPKALLNHGYLNEQLDVLTNWLLRLPSAHEGISIIIDTVRTFETKDNG